MCMRLSVVLPARLPAGLPVGLPAGLPAGLSVGLSVCLLSAWVKRYMMYMYIDVNLTCIYLCLHVSVYPRVNYKDVDIHACS